jgi:hypothetical protein
VSVFESAEATDPKILMRVGRGQGVILTNIDNWTIEIQDPISPLSHLQFSSCSCLNDETLLPVILTYMIHTVLYFLASDRFFTDIEQCCGSGSEIRYFFYHLNPESESQNDFAGALILDLV